MFVTEEISLFLVTAMVNALEDATSKFAQYVTILKLVCNAALLVIMQSGFTVIIAIGQHVGVKIRFSCYRGCIQ